MAAEEFNWSVNGKPIEIISADHQNKPDIGAAIARRWFDVEHIDVIADLTNSAVGFAVVEIARPLNKIVLVSGPDHLILPARPVRRPASSGRGIPTRRRQVVCERSSGPTLTHGSSSLRILPSVMRLNVMPLWQWKN
jgi:hypothetical protein